VHRTGQCPPRVSVAVAGSQRGSSNLKGGVMAKRWRCIVGWHDWRKFETPDGEKGAECSRCGKRDWHYGEPPHMSSKWRVPPGDG
jgi:hypothetical protein